MGLGRFGIGVWFRMDLTAAQRPRFSWLSRYVKEAIFCSFSSIMIIALAVLFYHQSQTDFQIHPHLVLLHSPFSLLKAIPLYHLISLVYKRAGSGRQQTGPSKFFYVLMHSLQYAKASFNFGKAYCAFSN